MAHHDTRLCAELGKMGRRSRPAAGGGEALPVAARARGLNDADSRRSTEIISFAINLEHIGDIIDKSLRKLIAKKIKYQSIFSAEGRDEIEGLYARTGETFASQIGIRVGFGDHQCDVFTLRLLTGA